MALAHITEKIITRTIEERVERVTLELTPNEADLLARLLFCHISGESDARRVLTDDIGSSLRDALGVYNPAPLRTGQERPRVLYVEGA